MITKTDIIKMAKKIVKRTRHIPERRVIHPSREWMTGLAVATLLLTAGFTYAGFTFLYQLAVLDRDVIVDTNIVRYRQDLVGEALKSYRFRKTQFETLREKQGVPPVIITVIPEDEETEGDTEEETPIPDGPLDAE